jgi:Ca-activated chloride channel family protein
MRRFALVGSVCVVSLAPTPIDPGQQPQFRGGTRTVPVHVTVRDSEGRFALDLTKDDFEIRDEGKVQTITQFTTATQTLSSLILLDGSSSMWSVWDSLIEGANSFIIRMLPGDRTAIASFADRFQMRQPFTSDRDELLTHLRDPFNVRSGLETRLWDALAEGVLAVGTEPNRRVLVVLSDGKNWVSGQPPATTRAGQFGRNSSRVPGPAPPPMATPSSSARAAGAVAASAMARDVMVYGIGMWTTPEKLAEAPDQSLARLADGTGGGYFELRLSDDINATFTQIVTELHQQYLLGFVPARLDGKVHTIDVRVKRPGVKVRARRSYLAAADEGRAR